MSHSLLIIVMGDPRWDARPAEAVRLAAGLAVWRRVRVSLYFRGPAILCLQMEPDELQGEENFRRYLPLLQKSEVPVLVQADSEFLPRVGEAPTSFRALSDAELSQLAAEHSSVLTFS